MRFISRKLIIAVWFLMLGLAGFAQNQTLIVDNNLQRPAGNHIFSNFQDAVDFANPGDVILVKASRFSYTNVTINKPLVIIGEGFKGLSTSIGVVTLTMDASNSSIMGMNISNELTLSGNGTSLYLQDVDIAYNNITRIRWGGGSTNDTLQNITIRSNIIGSANSSNTSSVAFDITRIKDGFYLQNNVVYGSAVAAVELHRADISNNVFVGTGTELTFYEVSNCSVNNNIFYGSSPYAQLPGTSSNNSFFSNLTYSTTDDDYVQVFDQATGIGYNSGYNERADPLFLSLPLATSWDFETNTLEYDVNTPAGSIGPDPVTFSLSGKWIPFISSIVGPHDLLEGAASITLDLQATVDAQLHDVPSLVAMEYFFDEDPGIGQATDAQISVSGSSFSGQVTINTSGLAPGRSTLYLRVRDGQRWGPYVSYPVVVYGDETYNFKIAAAEYFYDEDPGFGAGEPLDLGLNGDLASAVDMTSTLLASGLSLGFHTLYIRVQDQYDNWGLTHSSLVYVDDAVELEPSLVAAIEFFFDEDPGYGQATRVNVPQAASSIDLMIDTISTSGLSIGFHNLHVRVQDEAGSWSLPVTKLVYADQSGVVSVEEIAAIEYFFDEDPGYGQGVEFAVPTPDDSVHLTDAVSTEGLAAGFHQLFIRVQDAGGTWSLPVAKLLYLDEAGAEEVALVERVEYFFDTDPGYGAATSVALEAATDIDEAILLNAGALPIGFHNVYVRVQDEAGNWSLPATRLIYVDRSSTVYDVSQAEYFFDADPGHGNGISIEVATAKSVELTDQLDASALTLGFHQLFIRAADENGNWGLAESSLVYVDQDQVATRVNLTELEYFIGVDPGFGNGVSLPVDPAGLEASFSNISIDPGSLSDGTHYVTVRAKNADGTWGLGQSFPFVTYDYSRELDSVSLLVMYDALAGATWTNRYGWGIYPMDYWYGVRLKNGRVDSLGLAKNNLDGKMPFQAGYLAELKELDLSENKVRDTVPTELLNLPKLEEMYLDGNHLHELPDLSQINTLHTLTLDSNFFDFGDLEPLAAIPDITYSNQVLYGDVAVDSIVGIGQQVLLSEEVGGVENLYEWRLDGQPVPFGDFVEHTISSFAATDSGTYQLHITNPVIADLELVSQPFRLRISDFEEDSLAMVSLYDALDGENWTNNANWLSGAFSTWSGLTIVNGRVREIDLSGNGLNGKLPTDFAYADALVSIDLSDNGITDTVPASWSKLALLEAANLSNNSIRSIPDLNVLDALNTLDVSGNALQFAELEKNLGIPEFNYLDQDSVSAYLDTLFDINANVVIPIAVSGSNNTYQWLKDESPMAGAASHQLTLNNIQVEHEGDYRLRITNGLVPNLTLTSGIVQVGVTSLKRDSTALRRFYEATGGDDWVSKNNWLESAVGEWQGVTLNNQNTRVISLNLPDNNLTASIPVKIRDITSMEQMDLSGNELTGMVNLSVMPKLTDLDVSNNRMGFAEIEVNLGIEQFNYSPQKKLGEKEEVKVAQGTGYEKTVSVSGQSNQYQWLHNGKVVEAATAASLQVDSLTYETMGDYHVEVTSEAVPGLTITSEPTTVLATADIAISAFGLSNVPIDEGTGYLLQIMEPGNPYDSTATTTATNDVFVFEDITLGDYLLALEATDNETYLPTYFKNTFLWAEADTLRLRADVNETVSMTLRPGVLDPNDGDGKVLGLVEAEFANEATNGNERVNARRKVKKAGCSMRRRTRGGGGRTGQDEDQWMLIAYVETNDDGQFEFENIPAGFYRFNIEYPGIPMDTASYVEFEIGDGGVENNTFILEAYITEEGIKVVKVKELGFYRKYFKNLEVFPVPANDFLNIRYDKLVSGSVEMRLLDLSGKTLYTQQIQNGYEKEIKMDVSALEDGYYLLHFADSERNNQLVMSYKLLIKHQ